MWELVWEMGAVLGGVEAWGSLQGAYCVEEIVDDARCSQDLVLHPFPKLKIIINTYFIFNTDIYSLVDIQLPNI